MEFMLLLWDDLDDWMHACRHLATQAVSEVAQVVAPIATTVLVGLAAFWGSFPDFLR
jgi:hypothetical protein